MRTVRALTLLLCAPALLVPAAAAGQAPVTFTAELGFRSSYLFAGIPFAADQVTQARVAASHSGFTINGFGVYDHDAGEVTEADIYGDYYMQATPTVGIYVGGAFYNFKYPDGWEGTPELYGGIVLAVPLSPTVHVAHDFDLGDGTLVLLALSQGIPLLSDGIALELTGHAGYNAEYHTSETGLSFADIAASLGISVGPLTLAPMVLVQRRLDDAFELYVPDEEVFGVTATVTF